MTIQARIEAEILRQCMARGAGRTLCPSEVARALEGSDAGWRALMPAVQQVALELQGIGKIDIFQKGLPIDSAALSGPIRLGLPQDQGG